MGVGFDVTGLAVGVGVSDVNGDISHWGIVYVHRVGGGSALFNALITREADGGDVCITRCFVCDLAGDAVLIIDTEFLKAAISIHHIGDGEGIRLIPFTN